MKRFLPKYPVFVPSRGRFETCLTAKFLTEDGCPFTLVVEPAEEPEYRKRFPDATIITLPWNGDDPVRRKFCADRGIENGGLIAVRNWIKEKATADGHERHWQIDDNISGIWRWWRGYRLYCEAGPALRATEDFVDRFENVAIAGLNYVMFAVDATKPFNLNVHVYSCTLVLNSIPHRWRLRYNDDTDICLQVLADGWCTVLMNAFLIQKLRTMLVKGGNTTDLYQGDGRLKMARDLERMWPGVVRTDRRFGRPQHVVAHQWTRFKTALRPKKNAKPGHGEYGMELAQEAPKIRSATIRRLVRENKKLADRPGSG